jgi:HSP20 family protein
MNRFDTSLLPVRTKAKAQTLTNPLPYVLGEFPNELGMLFPRFFNWLAPFYGDFPVAYPWDFSVTEAEKEYVVRAELPGFEEKELTINLCENLLTITAEKKEEREENRTYRTYRRTFTVPTGVDPSKIKATYRNGVLELVIAKPEGAKVKHIPIKVN